MSSFNLVLSTQHTYEKNAETEFWFDLLVLGDESPLIIHSSIPGILLITSKLDPFIVIHKLREILAKDPTFFQFVLKLVPIERVIESDIEMIKMTVESLLEEKRKLTKRGKYAVQIKRRSTDLDRNQIIEAVTEKIHNKVDLRNPDWIVKIEIIGNITGISIIKSNDVLNIVKEKAARQRSFWTKFRNLFSK